MPPDCFVPLTFLIGGGPKNVGITIQEAIRAIEFHMSKGMFLLDRYRSMNDEEKTSVLSTAKMFNDTEKDMGSKELLKAIRAL